MSVMHSGYDRPMTRHEQKVSADQGLEQLEPRLLMAADISAAVVPNSPGVPEIEVGNGNEGNRENKGNSAKTSYDVVPWAKQAPLKITIRDMPLSKKLLFKQNKKNTSKGIERKHALSELDKLFSAVESSNDSHRNWVGQWASRHLALAGKMGPEMAKQTAAVVLKGFGQKYAPDSSSIFAFNNHGETSFKEAYTNEGNNAAISDLKLWRSARMEAKLQSAGVDPNIKVHVYTARFGAGPSHMGIAMTQTHWAGTEIAFLPMTMAKVGGLSAKDAAAFLAHQLDGKGDFTDFVRNHHGNRPPASQIDVSNPIGRAAAWNCDYRELAACSAEILASLESELADAQQGHDQAINELMAEFGEDHIESRLLPGRWLVRQEVA